MNIPRKIGVRRTSLTVRLSRDEKRMVEGLARRDGISASDVLRMLVRREWGKTEEGGL